jgi:hypothetical protein
MRDHLERGKWKVGWNKAFNRSDFLVFSPASSAAVVVVTTGSSNSPRGPPATLVIRPKMFRRAGCNPSVILPFLAIAKLLKIWCGQGRNRTADAGLFRAALYQLSYLARWWEKTA